MNVALLIFLLFYFAATFILPSWLVWKKTGINPVVLPKDDSAYGFVGHVFRLLIGLILLTVAVNAFWPEQLAAVFPPFVFFEKSPWIITGWVLLDASWLIIVVAQRTMRQSWRIGIDTTNRTDLVQRGLFAWSRNPIFLGMLLLLVGLFFLLPNTLTLLALACAWVVISVQIRLEEDFLAIQHGETYRVYQSKVRRWL